MPRFFTSSLLALALASFGYAQTPIPSTTLIQPAADLGKCLEVRGAVFANGTPVQIYDCNNTNAQKWEFDNLFRTKIRVVGTNFCLDAGNLWELTDGTQLKIWDCYEGLPQQDWAIEQGRIRLSGIRNSPLNNCLDLTDGRTDNTNVVQAWQCNEGNLNQQWVLAVLAEPPTSTEPPPPVTSLCPQPSCAACPSGEVGVIINPPGGCPTCACVTPVPTSEAPEITDPPAITTN